MTQILLEEYILSLFKDKFKDIHSTELLALKLANKLLASAFRHLSVVQQSFSRRI